LAEIARQVARDGGRVLLLAPSAASVDVVLQRLAGRPEVFPIRFLDPEETAEALPAEVRGLTLAEQQQTFRERTLLGARQAHELAEEACHRRQREDACWPPLAQTAERYS